MGGSFGMGLGLLDRRIDSSICLSVWSEVEFLSNTMECSSRDLNKRNACVLYTRYSAHAWFC
jgi:hypothetical protein